MSTTTPSPTPVQVPVTVWEPRTYPGDLALTPGQAPRDPCPYVFAD